VGVLYREQNPGGLAHLVAVRPHAGHPHDPHPRSATVEVTMSSERGVPVAWVGTRAPQWANESKVLTYPKEHLSSSPSTATNLRPQLRVTECSEVAGKSPIRPT